MPLLLSCIPPWLILWKIMATVVFPRNPSSSTQHSPHMAMAGPDCLFNTSTPTTSALIDPIGIAWINCCAKVLQLKCDKSGWFQIYQMTQTTSPRTSSTMDGCTLSMKSLVARIIRCVSSCTMGGWHEWGTTRGASYMNRIILFCTQWETV